MQSNWYESFFHGVALDLWRRAITPEMTRADADYLVHALDVRPGARLLDVPCGNGRHSLELAGRGFQMTGVDIAGEFIEEARAASAARSLNIEWIQNDMRCLPGAEAFDGAFCMGNSFGYLEHAGTVEFLGAVSKSLKPGGRFVLETGLAAESILRNLQERGWMQVDDILFLSVRRYNVAESRLEIEYTFVRNGKADRREASQAVYTVAEIKRLLASAGLRALALHGGPSPSSSADPVPFELGSPRLLVVAQKAA